MTFGERVRALRVERRLSLRKLSQKIGMADSYLSRVERDIVGPSDKLVHLLADQFDLPELYRLAVADKIASFKITSVMATLTPENDLGITRLDWWPPGLIIEHDPDKAIDDLLDEKGFVEKMRKQQIDALKDLYPSSDPYLPYIKYDKKFPDIDHGLEDIEYIEHVLSENGVGPDLFKFHPALRKRLEDLACRNADTFQQGISEGVSALRNEENAEQFDSFIGKLATHWYTNGETDGIKQAVAIQGNVQKMGEYYLLSMFYSPEVAKAIANYIKTLKLVSPEVEIHSNIHPPGPPVNKPVPIDPDKIDRIDRYLMELPVEHDGRLVMLDDLDSDI